MKIFLVCFISWLVAQLIKVVTHLTKYYIAKKKGKKARKVTLSTLFKLGGMPSSHTATVATLANCIGLHSGFDSDAFAIAGVFAFIVMFDAYKLRLPVENLTEAFTTVQRKVLGDKAESLEKVEGHTIPEILGGLILGICVSFIVVVCFDFLGPISFMNHF